MIIQHNSYVLLRVYLHTCVPLRVTRVYAYLVLRIATTDVHFDYITHNSIIFDIFYAACSLGLPLITMFLLLSNNIATVYALQLYYLPGGSKKIEQRF